MEFRIKSKNGEIKWLRDTSSPRKLPNDDILWNGVTLDIMEEVLVKVDDEEGARFGFTKYLTKAGFVIREASCLSEAREALTSQRFSAVLLDLNLPDGNGIDWIIELRETLPDIPGCLYYRGSRCSAGS